MKVSGLLITKNNGKTLDWALSSVREYLDELIIIDDFSTDNTVEIAEKHGAKVIQHKFEDFSKQRNFGIRQCSGDWIFTMDADEVMGENIAKAFKYLKSTRYRSFLFPRYNMIDLDPEAIIISPHHYSEWQVRMFVNDGKCYYENPVHHQLKGGKPRLKIPEVNIFHFHFLMYDYATRKKRVEYYESISPDSGSPKCYLFEDYPHSYQYTVEHITPELKSRLLTEMQRVKYSYTVDGAMQKKFERKIANKIKFTKVRNFFGI